MDSSVGNHCLKLILLILQAHNHPSSKFSLSDKKRLLDELKHNKCSLVYQLIRLHEENSSESDDPSKAKKVMRHILKLVYWFDRDTF